MKNIVAYQTEHATSRFLIELFANGINEYSKTTKVLIKDINEFLKVGFPSNINGIIVHGILRGTGLALKEAKKRCQKITHREHTEKPKKEKPSKEKPQEKPKEKPRSSLRKASTLGGTAIIDMSAFQEQPPRRQPSRTSSGWPTRRATAS